jgi:hypothetical protein
MSIETSYGFRSAQAAWENANPYDSDCACDPLFQCMRCEELGTEGGECHECSEDWSEGENFPVFVEIDREDNEFNSSSSCRQHGGCGGCYSRHCEDCGGDYEPDYDD